MAININTVYKTVLSVLNKEQRGYLTPDEFNKIARQAQLQLLDIAFAEYNKMLQLDTFGRTNLGYADAPSKIKEKIDSFYTSSSITLNTSTGLGTLPSDIYKLIDLSITNQTISLEQVDKHELSYMLSSPLTKPSADFPVYYKRATTSGATEILVEPAATDSAWTLGNILCTYIKVPTDPRFGYTRNATYGTNVYDSNPYIATGLVLGASDIGIIESGNTGLLDGDQTIIIGTTSGVTTSGSGTGASITLTISSGAVTAVVINIVGSGFAVDDTITISNTLSWLGADDLVLKLRSQDIYSTTTRGSTDFELHPQEETNLLLAVMGMAGVVMKQADITQLTSQIAQTNAQIKGQ